MIRIFGLNIYPCNLAAPFFRDRSAPEYSRKPKSAMLSKVAIKICLNQQYFPDCLGVEQLMSPLKQDTFKCILLKVMCEQKYPGKGS